MAESLNKFVHEDNPELLNNPSFGLLELFVERLIKETVRLEENYVEILTKLKKKFKKLA